MHAADGEENTPEEADELEEQLPGVQEIQAAVQTAKETEGKVCKTMILTFFQAFPA